MAVRFDEGGRLQSYDPGQDREVYISKTFKTGRPSTGSAKSSTSSQAEAQRRAAVIEAQRQAEADKKAAEEKAKQQAEAQRQSEIKRQQQSQSNLRKGTLTVAPNRNIIQKGLSAIENVYNKITGRGIKDIKIGTTPEVERYIQEEKRLKEKQKEIYSPKLNAYVSASPTGAGATAYIRNPTPEEQKKIDSPNLFIENTKTKVGKNVRNVGEKIPLVRDIISSKDIVERKSQRSKEILKELQKTNITDSRRDMLLKEYEKISTVTLKLGQEEKEVPVSELSNKGIIEYSATIFGKSAGASFEQITSKVIPEEGIGKIKRKEKETNIFIPQFGTTQVDPSTGNIITGEKIIKIPEKEYNILTPNQIGKSVEFITRASTFLPEYAGGFAEASLTGGEFGGAGTSIGFIKQKPVETILIGTAGIAKGIKYLKTPVVTRTPLTSAELKLPGLTKDTGSKAIVKSKFGTTIYEGIPYNNLDDYNAALKRLTKYGYTESQARQLIRLRKPTPIVDLFYSSDDIIKTAQQGEVAEFVATGKVTSSKVSSFSGKLLKEEEIKTISKYSVENVDDLSKLNLPENIGNKIAVYPTDQAIKYEGSNILGYGDDAINKLELFNVKGKGAFQIIDDAKSTGIVFSSSEKKAISTYSDDVINIINPRKNKKVFSASNIYSESDEPIKSFNLAFGEGTTTKVKTGIKSLSSNKNINLGMSESKIFEPNKLNKYLSSESITSGTPSFSGYTDLGTTTKINRQVSSIIESDIKNILTPATTSSVIETTSPTITTTRTSSSFLPLVSAKETSRITTNSILETTTPTRIVIEDKNMIKNIVVDRNIDFTPKNETANKTILISRKTSGSKSKTLLSSLSAQDTLQEKVQEVIQTKEQRQEQKKMSKLLQRSLLKNIQIQQPLIKNLLKETKITKPAIPITKPIIPLSPSIKSSQLQRLAKKADSGALFEAVGFRFGKEVSLGKGTKEKAKTELSKFLTETLGASGFLKTSTGEKIKAEETGLLLGETFRKSKRSPFLVVERKEKRLRKGTTGREIQYFKSKVSSNSLLSL